MISIAENKALSISGVSIWDMLAGRGMSKAEQMALVGSNLHELPAIMVTSCETAEDIRTQLNYALEVNDGQRVTMIYEEPEL